MDAYVIVVEKVQRHRYPARLAELGDATFKLAHYRKSGADFEGFKPRAAPDGVGVLLSQTRRQRLCASASARLSLPSSRSVTIFLACASILASSISPLVQNFLRQRCAITAPGSASGKVDFRSVIRFLPSPLDGTITPSRQTTYSACAVIFVSMAL